MHAQRRPTIRRVRDWAPSSAGPEISLSIASALRSPAVPRDLLTPKAMPIARPYYAEDDEEEEQATLARFVPINSEVRALLDDPEQTLAYMRKVQASMPDSDAALDSLVAVYEERVERLNAERAKAAEIIAPPPPPPPARKPKIAASLPAKPADRAMTMLRPHLWKIVYSTICVWGLLQLALTR